MCHSYDVIKQLSISKLYVIVEYSIPVYTSARIIKIDQEMREYSRK